MKTGKKIWLCILGLLLIALGIFCIANPNVTLLSTARILGFGTLFLGIIKMIFTFRTQAIIPFSGSRMLSALIDIFFGCFILCHLFGTAISLPVLFAIWVIIQGISVAVQSFDYKKAGFSSWWIILILGICGAILGFFGLKNLDITAATLSGLIGIAIIILGLAHIFAVIGVGRIEKAIKD